MERTDILNLLVLAGLLMLSAFFSSSETALTTVNRIRIRTLAERGSKKALLLLRVFEQPEKMLSVILVGNNVVNLYASSLATTLTIHLFGNRAVGAATGLLTLAVLVFGELAPKTMATREAERISLRVAGTIRALMFLLTPVVYVVDVLTAAVLRVLGFHSSGRRETVTAEELRTIVRVGHEEGVIEQDERVLLDNVFDFGEILARDIMIPRIDMICVEEHDDYETLMELVRREKYTRIPVCRDSPDVIVGILNVKDLLFRDAEQLFSIPELMRAPLFTYEHKKTAELMVEMRKNFTNIAIVLDEYGVTAGMVTMEDILEEIVGEIRDEYDTDEEKSIRRVAPGEYLVDGNLRISELNDVLHLALSSEDFESVGGLVMGLLDHLPKKGESVSSSGVRLRVERMEKNRVAQLRLWCPAEKSVVNL
ncbi:CBS domain containing-hemolysin-like protein [Fusobacterium naviforme]|nr:HlyC/CorC family transporter [Fusobacterium naviforme]PSL09881.1 CBS domain containing-hemolysin-like protein [Fusobacterium naviforme]STO27844.1 Putative Mg2+ and Co2+ transporter CorB [Fusobacterium naviforme]